MLYEKEKAFTDDYFCLIIDSHMIFVCDWDVKIIAQWELIENLNSTISIDPKLTENLTDHGVNDLIQLMCMSRIETNNRNDMMQYADPD